MQPIPNHENNNNKSLNNKIIIENRDKDIDNSNNNTIINNIYQTDNKTNIHSPITLNNLTELSYSNFSFESKKYLMNYGLIDKR